MANAIHGEAVTFEAWLEDLSRFLVVIDQDEEAAHQPSSDPTQ